MNHRIWATAAARVIALTFVIAGVTACGERLSDTETRTPAPQAASPSAVVIGQAPAEPAPPATTLTETPQVTPPAGAQGDLTKSQESLTRPREGDDSSHSTLSPVTPQKAAGVDPQQLPERKAQ